MCINQVEMHCKITHLWHAAWSNKLVELPAFFIIHIVLKDDISSCMLFCFCLLWIRGWCTSHVDPIAPVLRSPPKIVPHLPHTYCTRHTFMLLVHVKYNECFTVHATSAKLSSVQKKKKTHKTGIQSISTHISSKLIMKIINGHITIYINWSRHEIVIARSSPVCKQ